MEQSTEQPKETEEFISECCVCCKILSVKACKNPGGGNSSGFCKECEAQFYSKPRNRYQARMLREAVMLKFNAANLREAEEHVISFIRERVKELTDFVEKDY